MFAVPNSVPNPALRSELGCLSIEERIDSRKLNFLFRVKTLDSSSLANEVYEVQRKFNFPGLVQECRKLLTKYELPNVIEETCKLTKNQCFSTYLHHFYIMHSYRENKPKMKLF